jgi:hypothetical protein
VKIKIGSEMVTREFAAKLLGIEFQDNKNGTCKYMVREDFYHP